MRILRIYRTCLHAVALLLATPLRCWPAVAAAPPITITPASVEVIEGDTLSFAASTTGTDPVTYQWSFQGTPLLGRTAPTLRLVNVTAEQQGDYTAQATSLAGQTATATARLTVRKRPRLIQNGQTNLVREAGWARFDVNAVDEFPLSYQWYFNDDPLPGATTSFLLFETASVRQSGLYTVSVSNRYAGVLSNPYVLQTTAPSPLDQWQWRHPALQGNDLSSIAFGAGLYVAVGTHGTLMVSSNAIDWQNRHEERFGDLQSIVYGDAGFVAVGSPGRIVTSPDGRQWAVHPQPVVELTRVIYGNGLYVALSPSRALPTLPSRYTQPFYLTSENGNEWVEHAWTDGTVIFDVEFGNGRFLAQGQNVYSSLNGRDWRLSATKRSGLSLRFGNGMFISLTNTISLSSDGETWRQGSAPERALFSEVAGGNGLFIAAAATPVRHGSDSYEAHILSSMDGLTWQTNTLHLLNNVHHAAFAGGAFFVLGDDGYLLTSTNGLDWRLLSAWDDVNLNVVVETPEEMRVVVGNAGRVLVSNAQSPWQAVPTASDGSKSLQAAAYGLGLFAAVDSTGAILTSSNAQDWVVRYRGTNPVDALKSVAFGNGRFVAVGESAEVVISTNGRAWDRAPEPLLPPWDLGSDIFRNPRTVIFANRRFITSDDLSLAQSPDGTFWTRIDGRVVGHQIAYGNGILAVLASGSQILWATNVFATLSGPLKWESPIAAPDLPLRGLTFGGGLFVATGDEGYIFSSPDARYWTRHYTACENALRAATYTQSGTFLVVGNNGAILESSPPVEALSAHLSRSGQLELLVSGFPGRRYRVQQAASVDSTSWQDFKLIRLPGYSTNLTDQISAQPRFYRLLSLPQ